MACMLMKCETKSSRVKGVAFHPTLQWCLTALHNGAIQLWDYRVGSLVDRFEEHEGPVRGVDFHASQPLFVSGGDDYQMKLWNLVQRKCIYTFSGHLDYIRTTFFHDVYPWILSASDDQTVRIWNWQSRACLAVLTGHTHYVMCARFHPTEDLVVSASLDQTLRLWDTSGLRERSGGVVGAVGRSGSRSTAHGDIFAATDAVCKLVLEGHERGANWATFHPSMPLIASAADDKLIKLWRYNSVKAWEVDTLRGHSNNVSCLVFHPHRDLLISDSEDRTIRVWDVSRRTCLHTFRRDMDRFWVLAAHPTSGAIAAGHDGGMVVFKLTTERPPSCMWTGHELLYVAERRLCWIDVAVLLHQQQQQQQLEVMLGEVRRPPNALANGPKQLLVNPLNAGEVNAVVVYTEGESLSYDFLCGPRADGRGAPAAGCLSQVAQGAGLSFAFIARNKLAILESAPNGSCLRVQTAPSASSHAGHATADAGRIEPLPVATDKIFFAGPNRLILLGEDKMYLYDVPSRRLSPPLTLNIGGPVRTVTWAPDMQHLALTSKHSVVLLRVNFAALSALPVGATEKGMEAPDPAFKVLASLHENIRVKGGVWDPEFGGFIYSTLSHVKFCMTNGDRGIVYSLSESIYIVAVMQQQLIYLDRRSQLHCRALACNDYLFRVALSRQDYTRVGMGVALLVRYGNLCGNALIGYLKEKGYSEIALEFLSDCKSKFLMSLEVGRMDEALEAAKALNDKAGWRLLADAAVQEGHFGLAEICLQKLKAFEKLSFLYLLLGDRAKLKKMLHVSKLLREPLLRQHQALLLGDAEERVDVFMEAQQPGLAYLCAKVHGLDELAEQLRGSVDEKDIEEFLPKTPVALFPPLPVMRFGPGEAATWKPAVSGELSPFAAALRAVDEMDPETARLMLHKGMDTNEADVAAAGRATGAMGDWAEAPGVGSDELEDFASVGAAAEGEWKDAIDIGMDDEPTVSCAGGAARGHGIINGKTGELHGDTPGTDPTAAWRQKPIPSDLVVAGDFTGAIQMLRRRLGLLRVAPFEAVFQKIYEASWVQLKGHSFAPPLQLPLTRGQPYKTAAPPRLITSAYLLTQVREAHKLVTGGKFAEALAAFRKALITLALAVAENQEEEQQLLEMLDICRTYITGMKLETERLSLAESDAQRNLELVAYFSCCRLQPSHSFLVLRRAMSVAWKAQNFITAASFARRLLSGTYSGLKGAPEELAKAKKVLLLCEQKGTDAININYEPGEAENMLLCTSTLTRLNPGTPVVRCGFCGAVAQQRLQGGLCRVCEVSELGARVVGVQFLPIV
ncbi:coatomer alpha subunit, putative [Eimeria maxima]|uniref:Coatomer alpha subunit, putative n=1 Tax=Eimeria maxima TaxID=5804 RepID=U6LXH4_EIMMA|nr:coatomer alpha subunit, putative [Eimeria maxima]CDJ56647.1 coatomer alpha subunit, putative [Eimeria maxima]